MKKPMIAGAVLLLALAAVLAWKYFSTAEVPAEPAPPVQAEAPAAPATAPAAAAAPAAAKVAAAPAPPKGSADAPRSIYESLQDRLDAIAKAYVAGDATGAENAMWPNHAVVRPNGDTLDRSALLGQWMTEWETFKDRKLHFALSEVYVEDEQVTAYWTLELTARVLGDDGELHDFEARGLQKASFQRERGVDLLEGPILYHGYEQTWDGMTFKPQ